MSIREIKAKSILRKHKKIDSWFISHYGMNLYRGCVLNCAYCDGRSEGYYVEGEFGRDVTVKTNAAEVLERELDPKRKRKPFKRSYIMFCGGICDGYQPAEKKYGLSRKALEIIKKSGLPVHILTKSSLVERDLDLLKEINTVSRVILSFSFSSTNDEISTVFEPGSSLPSKRLETIKLFKDNGIACGMFLMPVIPFITDTPEMIDKTLHDAREANVDFVIFSGMTLKEGKQQDYFYSVLSKYDDKLLPKYRQIYTGDKWGNPSGEYYYAIGKIFDELADKYKLPKRVPSGLFKDIVDEKDYAILILEHIDYLLKLKGKRSSYGYAAYKLSQLEEPFPDWTYKVPEVKGINPAATGIIREILEKGTCDLYEELVRA